MTVIPSVSKLADMNLSYEQLLLENDVLRETVFRLENLVQKLESRITQLDARVAQLEGRNAWLEERNVQLEKRNTQLEERNAQLEAQLSQNSKNSSKPPSTDQKSNQPPVQRKEKRPLHPGASRQLLPENMLSSRETRYVQICPRCRSFMEPTETVNSWQQIELPEIKPLVHQLVHQIDLITCKCPRCHLEEKPELNESEQFLLGPRMEAFVNLLLGQYRQGHRPVRAILATILPGVILSQGLISKIKARTAHSLAMPYERLIKTIASRNDPVHMDATGWRHLGSNEHVLVMRMGEIVSYALIARQDGATLAGLVGNRVHCLVSDRGLATAQIHVKIQQYCLAHLLRNVRGQAEHPGISEEDTQRLGLVYDSLQGLFKDKHRAGRKEISLSTWRQYGHIKWCSIQEELEELAKNGSTKKLRRFSTKLIQQMNCFRAYLKDPAIPMTNNPAEEALRNLVIARKLCFGSRSIYGKKWREALHSCVETLRRQGRSVLDFLAEVIRSVRLGIPAPVIV